MTVRIGIPPERAFDSFVRRWPHAIHSVDPPRRAAGDGWRAQFEPVLEGGTRIVFEGSDRLAGELEHYAAAAARD